MSSQPFGATPPPVQSPGGPAQDATAGANAAAAKRSPLIRFGVPVAAGLLLAGGLAAVLTGGPASDDTAPEAVSPPPATATPEPEPSLEAPETVPVSAQRNPFDPLVKAATVAAGPDAGSGTGGVGTTPGLGSPSRSFGSTGGSTGSATGSISSSSGGDSSSAGSSNGSGGTSSGSGNGSGSGSGGAVSGSGSGSASNNQGSSSPSSGNKPAPPPGPATPAKPDAVATCKSGDDLWKSYREAMKDASTTHTMAGHRLGPVATGVGELAENTASDELRQPLQAWERATASVRAQLVNGQGVRDVVLADPLENSTGGAPFIGTRPIVDESSILLARTSVRERCYQLTDPLVNQGDL